MGSLVVLPFLSLYTIMDRKAEEENPLLFYATLPLKFPLGLFPKPFQPYLELIRLEKVDFVNIYYIVQQMSL